MKDNLKIKGTVFLKLEKQNGEVQHKVVENVVVNTGKEFFAKKIFNDSFIGKVAKIGIGPSKTNQTVSDTITSFNANSVIIKAIDPLSSGIENEGNGNISNQLDYVTTFFDVVEETLGGNNPVAIQELALIGLDENSPQEDVLLCRTTFADDNSPIEGFTKTTGDIITVTWRLTIN